MSPYPISENQSKCENKLTYYIDSSNVLRHGLYMKYVFFFVFPKKRGVIAIMAWHYFKKTARKLENKVKKSPNKVIKQKLEISAPYFFNDGDFTRSH